jgi:formate C-acetyltransferase
MAHLISEVQKDLSISSYNLQKHPLLGELKDELQSAPTEVCIERSVLVTQYTKANEKQSIELQRAGAIHNYLSQRKAQFLDKNLLAGNSTSKRLGAPVYPEYLGLSIWPELETISKRSANPQLLNSTDADTLNFDVFPYWMDRSILERTRAEKNPKGLKLMEMMAYFLNGKASVISHTTPYYEKMLSVGLNGIIAEAQEKKKALGSTPEKQSERNFYDSMCTALQGLINYSKNLSEAALEESKITTDTFQKKNLEAIAEVCSQVPANPPRNFREAVNALYLCHVGVLAENVNMALNPGRVDQLLYPFFERDYKKGTLSVDDAVTLCGCLLLKIGDNTNLVPETSEKLFGGAGSVPAITLGGVDKNGDDAVNDLTYIFLRAAELLQIRDPNVNARYQKVCGEDYRKRVSEVIINTKAIPAFYNDDTCTDTLKNQGVSPEDANDYSIIGCVELASAGREYSSSSSILLNLTAAMDLALYNGRRPYLSGDTLMSIPTGDASKFTTFKEFHDAFYTQVEWLLGQAMDVNEDFGLTYQKYLPTPLLSGLFVGPMDKGKDLIYGGAKYNSSGITSVGLADVCDSLNSIEYVLENKKATMAQVVDAVKNNFKSSEEKKIQKLLQEAPKYGTEDKQAVQNSKDLVAYIYELCQSRTNYRGGKYRPAYWTMTNHAGLGKVGWALPSGHEAHTVFSSGITPASQCAQELTVAFNSVGALNHQHIPGCYALNIKYSPITATVNKENFITQFSNLVAGYFANGGMQVQFNLYSYGELEQAMKKPEIDPYMLVRVSGYSAYFKDLNEAMKQELITRTQYDLFSKKAVPLTGETN